MSAVTVQEIVKALNDAARMIIDHHGVYCITTYEILAERIEQHGISPPDGWVLVPVAPTDAMQTAHDMYGDTSDWWNAVISAVMRAAAPEVKP